MGQLHLHQLFFKGLSDRFFHGLLVIYVVAVFVGLPATAPFPLFSEIETFYNIDRSAI